MSMGRQRCTALAVRMMLFLLFLSLCMPLASCGFSTPAPFTALDLGIPSTALRAPVVGPLPLATPLHVRITFKIDPKILQEASQQKIQAGKPSHIEAFAQKLGISDGTYQQIKSFFNTKGIILNLSKLRTHLAVNARAGTLAKLLQTQFLVHRYNGRQFFAPTPAPRIPTLLANSIDAITGLDNYSVAPRHDMQMSFAGPHTLWHAGQDCYPLQQTLLPRDVAHAYGYDQLWNHGWHGEQMTVNLVEVDGFYQDDIQNYLDCIQFSGNVSVEDVDSPPTKALGEAALDVEMVAGLARAATIVDYQTDGNANDDVWGRINDALQQILNDNVNNANAGSLVSISLGSAEGEMTAEDQRALNSSLAQLTQVEHMTVLVASGDCGAFTDGVYKSLSVSFPASDPWATSVGGTILQINQGQERVNEVVWADSANLRTCKNQWGSGGGNSNLYTRPSWQNATGVNNQFSQGRRQVPDLSAVAYALAIYFRGQWGAVGGTSAAAPIWAAGLALVNEGLLQQRQTFAYGPQLFYMVADHSQGMQPYYDVTQGNNLYYPATRGWDFATGLGTPNLATIYHILSTLPSGTL